MTSRDFCFWLQGYFEITTERGLTFDQVDMVKRHLSLVFKHEIDPAMGDAAQQQNLNNLHGTNPAFHSYQAVGDNSPKPRC